MKIALLYHDGLDVGGYPRDVRWLASALVRRGHEVSLIAREGSETDGLEGVEIATPDRFEKVSGRVDVVHSWGLFVPAQLLSERRTHKTRPGAPRVISPLAQLMPLHLSRSLWKKVPYLTLLRPTLRGVPRVAHFFSEEEYWASLHYLQPSAHFEATLGLFPPSGGFSPSPDIGEYLMFFGRNDITQKGLDVLVEGYRTAVRDGLDLPLLVAGHLEKGSTRYWRAVAQDPELSGRLELIGEVPDEERSRLLLNARCLVFPSRWDGPPRPIREAIALGTPVIVTNGTNMGQLVEDHGAGQLTALEASSIAKSLRAAADPELVKGWKKGVLRLRERLSWERVAGEYVAGYEMALNGPLSRPSQRSSL